MRNTFKLTFGFLSLALITAQEARADYWLQPCIYRRDLEQFATVPRPESVDGKVWDKVTNNHRFELMHDRPPLIQPGIKSTIENADDVAATISGEGMKLVKDAGDAIMSPVYASCLF